LWVGDTVAVLVRAALEFLETGNVGTGVVGIGNTVFVTVRATGELLQSGRVSASVYRVGDAVAIGVGYRRRLWRKGGLGCRGWLTGGHGVRRRGHLCGL
jgi:hypothetical protein